MRDKKLKQLLDIIKYEVDTQLEDNEKLPPLESINHLVESLGEISKALNKNDEKKYIDSMIKSSALIVSTLRLYMEEKGINVSLEDSE